MIRHAGKRGPDMSEFWNDKRLADVIEQALATPDIAQEFARLTAARQARMRSRVQDLRPRIVEAALADVQEQERDRAQLARIEAEVESLNAERGLLLRILSGGLVVFFGLAFFGVIGASIWAGGVGKLLALLLQPLPLAGVVVLALVLGAAIWIYGRRSDEAAQLTQALRKARADALQLEAIRQRIRDAEQRALAQGALAAAAAWRRAFAEFLKPRYAMQFVAGDTPGLNTAFNPHLVVETPARQRLLEMFEELRGANIGLAGPRGAGKSTLIQSLCAPHVETIGSRSALTLAVSAPVEYQARDFMLHLFASVCHRVLERLDPAYRRFDAGHRLLPPLAMRRDLLRALLSTALVGLVAGTLLVFISLALAVATAGAPAGVDSPAAAASAPAVAASAALSGASAASAPSSAGPALAKPASAAASAPDMAASLAASAAASAPTSPAAPAFEVKRAEAPSTPVHKVMAAMGLTPPALLAAALALGLGGVVLLSSVALKVRDMRRQAAPRAPAAPARPAAPAARDADADTGDNPLLGGWRWLRRLYADLADAAPAQAADALAVQAQHWLQEIKFQQSWTMGWSGALKMPFGLEGGANQARSMAQQQMSLPEVADSFTKFLTDVAQRYVVVIGIDELDKIESDEKAQRFLNDIKVVFGAPGVFFLVSVSEDAMSQFERRGLPFRDAFDSAFDEVIAVQPLDFESARLMLSERVIGLPVPFQALCWVMSGGVARELVRTARDLAEALRQAAPGTACDLADIAASLVRAEVLRKARAVARACERLATSADAVLLLRQVDELPRLDPLTPQALALAHTGLRQGLAPVPGRRRGAAADDAAQPAVAALARELSAYLLLLAAVLDFFDSRTLNPARLHAALNRGAADAGWLEMLPAALRLLAVHPDLARDRILGFLARSQSTLVVAP